MQKDGQRQNDYSKAVENVETRQQNKSQDSEANFEENFQGQYEDPLFKAENTKNDDKILKREIEKEKKRKRKGKMRAQKLVTVFWGR